MGAATHRKAFAALASLLMPMALASASGCGSSSSSGLGVFSHGATPCALTTDPATVILGEVRAADGHYVIAIGGSSTDSRIFFGSLDHLVEGSVTDRTFVDCGALIIEFVVDATTYSAVFPSAMCNGLIPTVLDEGSDTSHRQLLTEVVPTIPAAKLPSTVSGSPRRWV
jgi:hypothetical protein